MKWCNVVAITSCLVTTAFSCHVIALRLFTLSQSPQVVLGRRLLGVFMTVYMPTILMNIVGHSTMYFKPFFFEAQVDQNNETNALNLIPGVCQSHSDAGPNNNVCQVKINVINVSMVVCEQRVNIYLSPIVNIHLSGTVEFHVSQFSCWDCH